MDIAESRAQPTFGPYNPIRRAGDFYFVSGQVGVDPATKAASTKVEEQTSQALENLRSVLETQELDFADIVKTTIFVKDMADFATVNNIYIGFFAEPRPARSCVAVADLPHVAGNTELLVEIEAVAYRKAGHEQA